MREDAARTLWADDYEFLRERAREHLGTESPARPAGASRNVHVVSSRPVADDHVVETRRFARDEPRRLSRVDHTRERVPAPRSYGSRRGQAEVRVEPAPRRTVTITGRPTPASRRRSPAVARVAAEPDRIALWAVMLGIFLVLVALASAHV